MLERFTEESRRAVRAAVDAAVLEPGERVHTAHLLLGLAIEGGAVGRALAGLGLDEAALRGELAGARVISFGGRDLDTDALASIGVDYDAVRRAAEQRFGEGALNGALGGTLTRRPPRRSWFRRRGPVRLAGEARRALERTLRVAQAHGAKSIEPRHLLLGVLSNPSCIAVRLIERRGLTADQVRAAL
ncbi:MULTISPECIES: Clp protease N-terminal domain-containing protein [Parafrankia]|uniref:Peptidase n=1 Tax=Parafrankia soli TaxID=2599596 RepID=A0A1S1Q0Z0_9ACTN|nr:MULTISPECIES: Clp protease N-terminal domain-containing protein [Parafrankia]OHV27181.1 peptidase [Parafrankia soli]TCJ35473.1 peptidase [Parafrankia sp. BMG5.11]CAI7973909.1 Peptidase [Frankia sp. Hr75.2]SQD98305.1 Clp amino terminal domain-containing protein [Parafrankia sp. Ea1.12]